MSAKPSLLRSRSGRSHVMLPVPTRLLQTDIHSFLGVLRFCLLGPMSLSFSCHCIRYTNHRREHSQQNESHSLIGLFPRKECMSVWSSRVGTGSVTWLRPERLRRRLRKTMLSDDFKYFSFFFQSAWNFACRFQLNRKTSPCIFFRWFALRFRDITYAKTCHFVVTLLLRVNVIT